MQKVERKKDWSLNHEAFRNLLEWLDAGADSGGRKYLEMRERLVAFFDRKNCPAPDELADETLNRVARRLEEEGAIESETPARYCYITARFVFMEYLRSAQVKNVPLDEHLTSEKGRNAETDERAAAELREKMLACLEKCTGRLDAENREIILRYYCGEQRARIENRRALAEGFGISLNALAIRACRIRDKLEKCVGKCAGEENRGEITRMK
jgi:DNA-directed RNA polymerase specialized sigma24 family protein